ncbi:hypothetical protein Golax_005321 [Gossypium laxum]|uniref:Uncharacterized protein n=1 Tax=Gossypium laxum TaxID=34288 RepID=A0A7J9A0B2_9ROSI|nr:hypothetical protein [Gossypium laxum]
MSELTWTIEEEKLARANSKALNAIFCGVPNELKFTKRLGELVYASRTDELVFDSWSGKLVFASRLGEVRIASRPDEVRIASRPANGVTSALDEL